jgi:hypothetical protein
MPGFLPDIRLTPNVVERVQGRLMGLFGGMRARGLHPAAPAMVSRYYRPHYSTSVNPKKRKAKRIPIEALDSDDEQEDAKEKVFKRKKFKKIFRKRYKKRYSKNLVVCRLPPALRAKRKAANIEFRKLKATEPERERLFNEKEDQREKDFFLRKVERQEAERIRIARVGAREALRQRIGDKEKLSRKTVAKTQGRCKAPMVYVRRARRRPTAC